MPSACDDGPFGKGTGGELRYAVTSPPAARRPSGSPSAGSDKGLDAAQAELAGALQDPDGALAAKIAVARASCRSGRRCRCRATGACRTRIDWGKQNLADSTQTASDLQIRWTNQGKQFPAPLGTVAACRWFGAGYPDYPWIFATDGEYTNFAAVALGQFDTAKDHLRTLRDISDVLNDRSGVVVHEAVSDGSIWFGHDSQTTSTAPDERLQHRRDDQVPERCGAHLALDRRRPLPRRDVRLRQAQPAGRRPAPRRRPRRLARGLGQRRAHRHGPGEARQRRLLHPLAVRPGRHGAVQARRAHVRVGDQPRAQAPEAVRRHLVGRRGQPVRRLAGRPRQRAELPEALDRPGADGGRAETRATRPRRASPRATTAPPRSPAARRRASAATARAAVASSTRPAAAAPRARASSDLLADHVDPGRRRGQLRSPGPRPAAALHRRQRRDDVLRAGHGQHAGRAARRDARDLPVGPNGDLTTGFTPNITAAGPAGRWSCRRGATTAPPGR